jgi:two-component system sensor histidine kinase KdpD
MMEHYSPTDGPIYLEAPWPGPIRVMVCVGYNPTSERLLKRASFLANTLGGELLAVHFYSTESEVPGYQTMLQHNLDLARRLGAQVQIERAGLIGQAIAQFAQSHGVTHIVMGESARSRLEEVRRGSLVRQVMSASQGIDVYIIADPA